MATSFIIAGTGGQGVLSVGAILTNIYMLQDDYVTYTSSYGAEMRGGAVNCEINVSDSEIYSIQNDKIDYLISFNQISYDKFLPKVKENGTIILNSSLVVYDDKINVKQVLFPLTAEANKLGNIKIANSIALGVLAKVLGGFSLDTVKQAYGVILKDKANLIDKNIEAYLLGYNYSQEG